MSSPTAKATLNAASTTVNAALAVSRMQAPQPPQFYRRILPTTCVDFSSEEGKQLFIGAVNEGNTNIYFKLAAQFLTQEEPSFCGLSTLVMVLNALEVDPARVWKGAWRWYHESMLDCCIPLDIVLKKGITADQFECLARCNRLNVVRHNPPAAGVEVDETVKERFIENFRHSIRQSVQSNNSILVASYCRKTLGQTGSGHFSPLAGYNAALDKVLLMDVARFKYPPHWVSVPLLWESMRDIDPDTNRPRGYFILSLNDRLKPMLLLRLIDPSTMKELVQEMEQWFKECDTISRNAPSDDVSALAALFVDRMANTLRNHNVLEIREEYYVMDKTEYDGCCKQNCDEMSEKQVWTLVQELIASLEKTAEFKHLTKKASSEDGKLRGGDHRRALLTIGLFLSWPFETEKNCSMCVSLAEYCRGVVTKLPATAQNEVASLKAQIVALLGR